MLDAGWEVVGWLLRSAIVDCLSVCICHVDWAAKDDAASRQKDRGKAKKRSASSVDRRAAER